MKKAKGKQKKILVSGIKPTGELHFGNYFGAMKQNIELSNSGKYKSFIFIADYHALTSIKNKEEMNKNILNIAVTYIALGLNLEKTILFKQSDLKEVCELNWIFNNVVSLSFLERAHAFKAAKENKKDINLGIFTYPVLMAADILIHNSDIVPVGPDQKQHIEYTRDIAGYYNKIYNTNTFKLPNEYIIENQGDVLGVDGKKMSKSYDNTIRIFSTDEELKKEVFSIITNDLKKEDKKNPDDLVIYNIFKLFLNKKQDEKLREKLLNGGYSYFEIKTDLYNTILKWRKDKINIYNNLINNPKKIISILNKNKKIVQEETKEMILKIRKEIGLDF